MSEGVALIADDNGVVRYMVSQQVTRAGFQVITVNNGMEALAKLAERPFDVLLLDVMMPELDGLGVLAEIRKHSEWREMPVIMISGVEEVKTAAQCIEAGAEDYLTKPVDAVLLQARLKALMERRRLRDAERRYYRAMLESQQALRAEMDAAASYVRSLLPAPMSGPLEIDWRFIPSEQMGGDAFGYHWVTPDHLAVYLLDVCGHGFGATLLATSVLNVLRSQTLVGADFTDPSTVLSSLNDAFLMERQGGNYFTVWYGVYRRSTRSLCYASSTHPPALLVRSPDRSAVELSTSNPILGAAPGTRFESASQAIAPGDELYLYSDGALEVVDSDGRMVPFELFADNLRAPARSAADALDRGVYFVAQRSAAGALADDFSMVRVVFGLAAVSTQDQVRWPARALKTKADLWERSGESFRDVGGPVGEVRRELQGCWRTCGRGPAGAREMSSDQKERRRRGRARGVCAGPLGLWLRAERGESKEGAAGSAASGPPRPPLGRSRAAAGRGGSWTTRALR